MERRITFEFFIRIKYDKEMTYNGKRVQMWREEAEKMQQMGWGKIVETTHKTRVMK